MRPPEAGLDGQLPSEIACVEAGGHCFGIDVRRVREVVRALRSTPLPDGPPLIDGLIELRGTVIPVVDLGRAVGGEACRADRSARIVVVESGGHVFGLRVAVAHDVCDLDPSRVDPTPSLASGAGYSLVEAVARQGDEAGPILLLSLEALRARLGLREGSVEAAPCR